MLNRLTQFWNTGGGKSKTLAIIAASGLIVGIVLSSSLHWAGSSMANDLPGAPQAPVATLPAFPRSFAPIVEKLAPTVVNVKVTKVERVAFDRPELPDGPFRDFFEGFSQERPQAPKHHRTKGLGSGVIISHDGYVLTNNHVIKGATAVTVTLANKKEYKTRIVGRDPKTDLAILKIESHESFPASVMGDSDQLKVGDVVIAIGNPFGLNDTVTSGIVSAKDRVIGAGPYDDFIQTDASINPGNSGGPLFNVHGELVGINTAILPYGKGIGFAIPVNTAKPLIPQLVAKGVVTRGYLGVIVQSITPNLAKAMNLQDPKGALVADVGPGSPATKAGIKRGDVIVAYNGKAVGDSHDLPVLVAATPVGQEATVTVHRNGENLQLPIQVAQLPTENARPEEAAQPAKGKWGLQLRDLTPQIIGQLHLKSDQGVVVVGVMPGSRAAEAGIQQGDVILEVNRQPVSSVQGVMENIDRSKDKDQLLLLVQRENSKFFVPLEHQS